MAIPFYLAITPPEIAVIETLPGPLAWMGCHFSPNGPGLSELPDRLPPGAMLTLNDALPIRGHDPDLILKQLERTVTTLDCSCVLLDLQCPGSDEIASLVRHLADALPCPVGVSALYGTDLSCPVFLPPVPLDVSLEAHLCPWKGREIWLDVSGIGQTLSVTENGAASEPAAEYRAPESGFSDPALHIHYHMEIGEAARFHLFRTAEDQKALLAEAKKHSVMKAVGIYQELAAWNHTQTLYETELCRKFHN